MKRAWRRTRDRGQGLVEFAIVLPVMLLLIFGIIDLGRAVYAYSTIADAARTASRVAIVDQKLTLIQSSAANQAVALGIAPAAVAVSFRHSNLSGPCTPVLIGCVAEVTVPYTFSAVTPVIGNIVGLITMSSTTRLPIERIYSSP